VCTFMRDKLIVSCDAMQKSFAYSVNLSRQDGTVRNRSKVRLHQQPNDRCRISRGAQRFWNQEQKRNKVVTINHRAINAATTNGASPDVTKTANRRVVDC